ncbi:MAG: FAD-binding oxidoreductase [Bauldia sp.]|nr:FAD-binding oxidoreductase [Bauldia sp.]
MTHATRPGSVIIVGAGIVGVAAGYFLARAGVAVTILDIDGPAAGATGASDGAVSVASKKPGPMMRLALAGVATFRALQHEGVFTDEFAIRPTFLVAGDEEESGILDRHAEDLAAAGVAVRRLTGAGLKSRLPALGPQAIAAIEVGGEGHAIGYRVVHRLSQVGRLTIVRHTEVTGLVRDGAGRAVVGVDTKAGRRNADAVIVAAGTGSAELLGLQGVLRPRKGQLIVTERRGPDFPDFPGSLMSSRYLVSKGVQRRGARGNGRSFGLVLDPLATGQILIGGTREDSGNAAETDLAAVRRLLCEAVALSPAVACLRVLRVFAGVRTATADGLPLLGRMPGFDNAWLATGFEGDGICLGPLVGRVLQQLVCGEVPAVDIDALDPARFRAAAWAA